MSIKLRLMTGLKAWTAGLTSDACEAAQETCPMLSPRFRRRMKWRSITALRDRLWMGMSRAKVVALLPMLNGPIAEAIAQQLASPTDGRLGSKVYEHIFHALEAKRRDDLARRVESLSKEIVAEQKRELARFTQQQNEMLKNVQLRHQAELVELARKHRRDLEVLKWIDAEAEKHEAGALEALIRQAGQEGWHP